MIKKRTITNFIFCVLFIIFPCLSFSASTHTWFGSVNANWFNPANWDTGLPSAGDNVVIGPFGFNPILTNSTPSLATFIVSNKTVIVSNWFTAIKASNVVIRNGGIITLPPAFSTNQMSNRVWIVCTNLTLYSDSQINADSKGYYPWYGPGCPGYGGTYYWPGGSHGGRGAATWDDAPTPEAYQEVREGELCIKTLSRIISTTFGLTITFGRSLL